MQKISTLIFFKKSLIIFWFFWWLIALWTDVIGGLAHLNVLHASWAPDGNYPFLIAALKMYNLPSWVPAVCFMGIVAWLLLSTVVFGYAVLSLHKERKVWLRRASIAFIVSLSLWLAFFLADQVVMKFDLEENHMVQGGFQLLCYLALFILPNDD